MPWSARVAYTPPGEPKVKSCRRLARQGGNSIVILGTIEIQPSFEAACFVGSGVFLLFAFVEFVFDQGEDGGHGLVFLRAISFYCEFGALGGSQHH